MDWQAARVWLPWAVLTAVLLLPPGTAVALARVGLWWVTCVLRAAGLLKSKNWGRIAAAAAGDHTQSDSCRRKTPARRREKRAGAAYAM